MNKNKSKKRKLYSEFDDDYQENFETNKNNENNQAKRIKVDDKIPQEFRNIFIPHVHFNQLQSEIFDDVFLNDNSFVLSAPTSSGKTIVFEIGIVRLLMQIKQLGLESRNIKIIYISPIKALINEKYQEWSNKFQSILSCIEVTGDNEIQTLDELSEYQLILSTPEKWDSLTRRWRDYKEVFESIKLFLVDEVHLLNEDKRGPTLEAIVSRMKLIITSSENHPKLRFICASATIPNIEDLAQWLKTEENSDVKSFSMGESYRPVPLEKHVLGYFAPKNTNPFRFDIKLNYKLSAVINQYSENKPTLIFCSSRKSIELAAGVLETSLNYELTGLEKHKLQEVSAKAQDKKLKNILLKGIAYHHGGMSAEDRVLIENGFRKGVIPVLLSTTTLSMGVNLPAHLVIIKSTQVFRKGRNEEYDENTVMQMIGRCGRPQFDTKGVAVIMTQEENVTRYNNLVTGNTAVESHLHKHLTEHINSEIVLQTISNLSIAVQWIKSTFLYVRAYKNPANYGLPLQLTKEKVDRKLEDMCTIAINSLEKFGLITKNQEDGISVISTEFGKIMSRYYLALETMKTFNQIRGSESLMEMLNLLCQCHEFKDFTFRTNDKKHLNQLNQNLGNGLRYPIKGRIKMLNMKISCLIQASLGNITITDYSLQTECLKIMQAAKRISKCCIEWILEVDKKSKHGNYRALVSAVTLTKCLEANIWENSKYLTRQIEKIGDVYSGLLANAGYTSWEKIVNSDPRDIERIVGKMPPFGNEVIEFAEKLPKYELDISKSDEDPEAIQITVVQTNSEWQLDESKDEIYLIVGDEKNNILHYCDDLNYQLSSGIEQYSKDIKISQNSTKIHAHLIYSRFVGLDVTKQLDLKARIKPKTKILKNVPSKPKENKKVTNSNLNTSITDYFDVVKEVKPSNRTVKKKREINKLIVNDKKIYSNKKSVTSFIVEISEKINDFKKLQLNQPEVSKEESFICDDERCLPIDIVVNNEKSIDGVDLNARMCEESSEDIKGAQSNHNLNDKFEVLFGSASKKRLSSFELPQKQKIQKISSPKIKRFSPKVNDIPSTQEIFSDEEEIKLMEESLVFYGVENDKNFKTHYTKFQDKPKYSKILEDTIDIEEYIPKNSWMNDTVTSLTNSQDNQDNFFKKENILPQRFDSKNLLTDSEESKYKNSDQTILNTQQLFADNQLDVNFEMEETECRARTDKKVKNRTPIPHNSKQTKIEENGCISQLKEKCVINNSFNTLSLDEVISQWKEIKPIYFTNNVEMFKRMHHQDYKIVFNKPSTILKFSSNSQIMKDEDHAINSNTFNTPVKVKAVAIEDEDQYCTPKNRISSVIIEKNSQINGWKAPPIPINVDSDEIECIEVQSQGSSGNVDDWTECKNHIQDENIIQIKENKIQEQDVTPSREVNKTTPDKEEPKLLNEENQFKTPCPAIMNKPTIPSTIIRDPRYKDLFAVSSKKYFETPQQNSLRTPQISTSFFNIADKFDSVEVSSVNDDEITDNDAIDQSNLDQLFQLNCKISQEETFLRNLTQSNFICTAINFVEQIEWSSTFKEPEKTVFKNTSTIADFCDKSLLDDDCEQVFGSPGKNQRCRGVFPHTPSLSEIAGRFRRKQHSSIKTFEKIVENIVTPKGNTSIPRQRILTDLQNVVSNINSSDELPSNPPQRVDDNSKENSNNHEISMLSEETSPENEAEMRTEPISKPVLFSMKTLRSSADQNKNQVNIGKAIHEFQMLNDEVTGDKNATKCFKINSSWRKKPGIAAETKQNVNKVSRNLSNLINDEDLQERQKQIELCKKKLSENDYDIDSYFNDFLRLQFSDKIND